MSFVVRLLHEEGSDNLQASAATVSSLPPGVPSYTTPTDAIDAVTVGNHRLSGSYAVIDLGYSLEPTEGATHASVPRADSAAQLADSLPPADGSSQTAAENVLRHSVCCGDSNGMSLLGRIVDTETLTNATDTARTTGNKTTVLLSILAFPSFANPNKRPVDLAKGIGEVSVAGAAAEASPLVVTSTHTLSLAGLPFAVLTLDSVNGYEAVQRQLLESESLGRVASSLTMMFILSIVQGETVIATRVILDVAQSHFPHVTTLLDLLAGMPSASSNHGVGLSGIGVAVLRDALRYVEGNYFFMARVPSWISKDRDVLGLLRFIERFNARMSKVTTEVQKQHRATAGGSTVDRSAAGHVQHQEGTPEEIYSGGDEADEQMDDEMYAALQEARLRVEELEKEESDLLRRRHELMTTRRRMATYGQSAEISAAVLGGALKDAIEQREVCAAAHATLQGDLERVKGKYAVLQSRRVQLADEVDAREATIRKRQEDLDIITAQIRDITAEVEQLKSRKEMATRRVEELKQRRVLLKDSLAVETEDHLQRVKALGEEHDERMARLKEDSWKRVGDIKQHGRVEYERLMKSYSGGDDSDNTSTAVEQGKSDADGKEREGDADGKTDDANEDQTATASAKGPTILQEHAAAEAQHRKLTVETKDLQATLEILERSLSDARQHGEDLYQRFLATQSTTDPLFTDLQEEKQTLQRMVAEGDRLESRRAEIEAEGSRLKELLRANDASFALASEAVESLKKRLACGLESGDVKEEKDRYVGATASCDVSEAVQTLPVQPADVQRLKVRALALEELREVATRRSVWVEFLRERVDLAEIAQEDAVMLTTNLQQGVPEVGTPVDSKALNLNRAQQPGVEQCSKCVALRTDISEKTEQLRSLKQKNAETFTATKVLQAELEGRLQSHHTELTDLEEVNSHLIAVLQTESRSEAEAARGYAEQIDEVSDAIYELQKRFVDRAMADVKENCGGLYTDKIHEDWFLADQYTLRHSTPRPSRNVGEDSPAMTSSAMTPSPVRVSRRMLQSTAGAANTSGLNATPHMHGMGSNRSADLHITRQPPLSVDENRKGYVAAVVGIYSKLCATAAQRERLDAFGEELSARASAAEFDLADLSRELIGLNRSLVTTDGRVREAMVESDNQELRLLDEFAEEEQSRSMLQRRVDILLSGNSDCQGLLSQRLEKARFVCEKHMSAIQLLEKEREELAEWASAGPAKIDIQKTVARVDGITASANAAEDVLCRCTAELDRRRVLMEDNKKLRADVDRKRLELQAVRREVVALPDASSARHAVNQSRPHTPLVSPAGESAIARRKTPPPPPESEPPGASDDLTSMRARLGSVREQLRHLLREKPKVVDTSVSSSNHADGTYTNQPATHW